MSYRIDTNKQITAVFRCVCAYTTFLNTYIFLKYLHVIVTTRALVFFSFCKLRNLLSFREDHICTKVDIEHSNLIYDFLTSEGLLLYTQNPIFVLTCYLSNIVITLLFVTMHICCTIVTFALYITIDLLLGYLTLSQLNNSFQQLDFVLLPYIITDNVEESLSMLYANWSTVYLLLYNIVFSGHILMSAGLIALIIVACIIYAKQILTIVNYGLFFYCKHLMFILGDNSVKIVRENYKLDYYIIVHIVYLLVPEVIYSVLINMYYLLFYILCAIPCTEIPKTIQELHMFKLLICRILSG
jgi:hypothetical protein